MNLLTAAQMKEVDRIAIQEHGIASTRLMENAAKAIVGEVLKAPVVSEDTHSAIIYCGPGNNGGDGIAAARFLLCEGWTVKCVLVGERQKMTEDSREMERRLNQCGGVLDDFDIKLVQDYARYTVAIDALFGVGLHSELRLNAQQAVQCLQKARWVVAADIPSGIHADTGEELGCSVKADVTVTFSSAKPGLFVGKGAVQCGRVVVADIGIPSDITNNQPVITFVMDKPCLLRRRRDAHKGDFGKLFLLAGSVGYTGAPVLASRAAVRSGAGLVTMAVPEQIYPIVAVKCDEAMVWPWSERYEEIIEKANACHAAVIGPGLGQSEQAEKLVLDLLHDLTCPVVLDADGLNILSRHMDVLKKRAAPTILTPHDGEFSRLSGIKLPITDRLTAARNFAKEYNCVLVLKGYRTITADPYGECVINPTGNPGMARGGAGDALAGLIGGLLVQGRKMDDVSRAVWIHGRAGDLAAADKGEYGMTISDLIEQMPYAMKECEEE